MISLLFDHLRQSSLFAGGTGLLTWGLSRNRANVRFWLWFSASRKLLLSASAAAIFAIPVLLSLAVSSAAPVFAQTEPTPSPGLNAEMRAEQAQPRNAVPFYPPDFDRYVGYYQLGPSVICTVSRDGGHFLMRLTGQVNVEVFPESLTEFFSTQVRAQISFDTDAQGQVTGLVLHQGGFEQAAPRISEDAAKAIEAALAQRVLNNSPSPGTEAAVRHQVESEINDQPDYSVLMPALAAATREQWPILHQITSSFGALKSISFKGVTPGGLDIYEVTFDHGNTEWRISPLTADGKITTMMARRLP